MAVLLDYVRFMSVCYPDKEACHFLQGPSMFPKQCGLLQSKLHVRATSPPD